MRPGEARHLFCFPLVAAILPRVMAKTSKLKTLCEGKHIKLVQRGTYEFASRKKTSGIVAIVAVTDDDKLLLIEQFRPPVNKRVIEIPAGLAGDIEGHEREEL